MRLSTLVLPFVLAACSRVPPGDEGDTDTNVIVDHGDTDEQTEDTADSAVDTDTEVVDDTDVGPVGCAGGAGTVTTITDIRDGMGGFSTGDLVAVCAVVVTAVRDDKGFTVQDAGAISYGGIYVYQGLGGVVPAVGDLVDIVGVYEEFDGSGPDGAPLSSTAQLFVDRNWSTPQHPDSSVLVVGTGTLPTPVDVTASTLASSASAEPFESMLVTLTAGCPLSVSTDPSAAGSFYEFDVTADAGMSTAVVDGEYYFLGDGYASLAIGDSFSTITGPLFFSYGEYKVAPRSAADATGYAAGGAGCP
jgi:hypothetical protein